MKNSYKFQCLHCEKYTVILVFFPLGSCCPDCMELWDKDHKLFIRNSKSPYIDKKWRPL